MCETRFVETIQALDLCMLLHFSFFFLSPLKTTYSSSSGVQCLCLSFYIPVYYASALNNIY